MKIPVCLSAIPLMFLCACTNPKPVAPSPWADFDENSWPQVLLTNEIYFRDRMPVFGASAFLLCGARDTFACTAKHLLGKDMGMEPEVQPDSVNGLMEQWILYPRKNTLSHDTVTLQRLINTQNREKDILLFGIKNIPEKIKPLKPSFEKLEPGEEVMVIGCEYGKDCHQKFYPAKIDSYEGGKIFIKMKDGDVELQGFSGAPCINKNGEVIGLVSRRRGGFFGEAYVELESVAGVREFLNP